MQATYNHLLQIAIPEPFDGPGSVQAEFDIRSNTMLTILNSISSLNAENALSSTQANLQKTLTQLSSGLKINSGADDAAGLSIANGLQANIAALTQSSSNASDGIGVLQTADGAMSQVTTLLNRAVTLATEASNGGLSTDQSTALDTEYQSILTEITNISGTTNFNGTAVFGSTPAVYETDGSSTGSTTLANTAIAAVDASTLGLAWARSARADERRSERYVAVPVIESVFKKNKSRNAVVGERLKKELGDISGKRFAMFGVTYKAGTSTLRRSQPLEIEKSLRAAGSNVPAL